MLISNLDHFTLRTCLLDESRRFFEDVAALRVGARPAFKFPGYWLYQDSVALVHLAGRDDADVELQRYLGRQDGAVTMGSGLVDHIAFRCKDLPGFEERLRLLKKAFRPRTVPELHEHQVFVVDPNGITVEFIFSADESASWVTDAAGVALSIDGEEQ